MYLSCILLAISFVWISMKNSCVRFYYNCEKINWCSSSFWMKRWAILYHKVLSKKRPLHMIILKTTKRSIYVTRRCSSHVWLYLSRSLSSSCSPQKNITERSWRYRIGLSRRITGIWTGSSWAWIGFALDHNRLIDVNTASWTRCYHFVNENNMWKIICTNLFFIHVSRLHSQAKIK